MRGLVGKEEFLDSGQQKLELGLIRDGVNSLQKDRLHVCRGKRIDMRQEITQYTFLVLRVPLLVPAGLCEMVTVEDRQIRAIILKMVFTGQKSV